MPALIAWIAAFFGAALVHRGFVAITVCFHGLVKGALCRQQKVDGISLLVSSGKEIFLGALDLDVGVIYARATTDQPLCLRAISSISGNKQIAHRLINEWSTDTPRSSIISPMFR